MAMSVNYMAPSNVFEVARAFVEEIPGQTEFKNMLIHRIRDIRLEALLINPEAFDAGYINEAQFSLED